MDKELLAGYITDAMQRKTILEAELQQVEVLQNTEVISAQICEGGYLRNEMRYSPMMNKRKK